MSEPDESIVDDINNVTDIAAPIAVLPLEDNGENSEEIVVDQKESESNEILPAEQQEEESELPQCAVASEEEEAVEPEVVLE